MRFGFLARVFGKDLEEEVQSLRREILALRSKQSAVAPRSASALEPLLVVARALREATSAAGFADAALRAAVATSGAARGALVTAETPPSEANLALVVARDARQKLAPAELPWSRAIALAAIEGGQPVATGRAAEDVRFSARESVARFQLESVLALPLAGAPRPGCLYLEAPPAGFGRMDATALLAMTDLIAVGLARLEHEVASERRAKLEAIGVAAAAIAHDLRSPLATVELGLTLVTASSSEDARTLARVKDACARANDLASVLVGLATGRERPLDVRPGRVGEIVERQLALLEPELRACEIALERSLDREVEALVDAGALARIVDNLVRNAQRAMTDGGRLEASLEVEPLRVTLTLEDTGPGLPPEQAERAFELGPAAGARGLGLFLVGEMVRACGGAIRVEARAGGGTRFRLSFPRQKA